MRSVESGFETFCLGSKAFLLGSRPFGELIFGDNFDCIEVVLIQLLICDFTVRSEKESKYFLYYQTNGDSKNE